MKIQINGCILTIDEQTGAITGDTYKMRLWIKDTFGSAKWDGAKKAWSVSTDDLTKKTPYINSVATILPEEVEQEQPKEVRKPPLYQPVTIQQLEQLSAYNDKVTKTERFYSSGWESHEISIDTGKDVEEQLRRYAEYYSNDCTYDSLKRDYASKWAEKSEKAAEAAAIRDRIEQIKAAAKTTGERQCLCSYMDECDDPREECSYDAVTIWAMPDGTEKTTRQHTW